MSETLERFGLRHYFSAIVVSREFGWLKPHPRSISMTRDCLETRGLGFADCCRVSSLFRLRAAARRFMQRHLLTRI